MPVVPFEEVSAGVVDPKFVAPNLTESPGLWGAAFRTENSVFAAISMAGREVYDADESFSFKEALSASSIAQNNPNPFLSVQSQAEFNAMELRLITESRDRELLASAGWAGLGVQIAAGVLDPTVLLPGGMFGKGIKLSTAVARAAGWELLGVSTQEAILQSDQVLRTPQESAINIASTVVMAGILGAAIGTMTKKQAAAMAKRLDEEGADPTMVPHDAPTATGITATGAGAQATPAELLDAKRAGGLAKGLFGSNKLSFLSPVLRNFQQKYSATVQWAQAQIDTGGVTLDRNVLGIASAAGGDIISLKRQWDTGIASAKRANKEFWSEHRADGGQLSRKEFNLEVGKGLSELETHKDKHVAKTVEWYRREIYLPMFAEAKRLGMKGFADIPEEDLMKYFPRNVRKKLAGAERVQFEEILAENANEQLMKQWQRKQNFAQTRAEEAETAAKDVLLKQPEADVLEAQLQRAIAQAPDEFPEVRQLVNEIRGLRAEARATADKAEAKLLRDEATALEKINKDVLKDFKLKEGGLKRRFASLTKGRANLERRQRKVLDLIETVEDQQLSTMGRTILRAQKLLNKIDTLSDDAIETELEAIQKQIDKGVAIFERGEASIAKREKLPDGFEHLVDSDVRPSDKISIAKQRQETRAAKNAELKTKMDDAIEGRTSKREALEEVVAELEQRSLNINNKRAVRLDALRKRAGKLDPEGAKTASAKYAARATDIRARFYDAAEAAGNVVPVRGKGPLDFVQKSQEIASDVADRMLGQNGRHPYFSLMTEMGPELARTLHIDPNVKWSNGRTYGEFLEYDVEKATTSYVRTMGGDIEILRKFGTLQPLAKDGKLRIDIKDDFKAARKEAAEKFEGKALEKEFADIARTEVRVIEDLQAGLDRIRHIRGLPDDAASIPHRMGRIARQLNTMRLMGSVVISSIPDLARPIMVHGLMRTFRDGWLPMLANMKQVKLNLQEARLAGTALDLAIHGRSNALFDVMDEFEYGTMGERALQTASNNFGLISGFDHWNTAMKSITANIAIVRIQDSIETVMTGVAGRKLNKALRFLAKNNLGEGEIKAIWKEVNAPGGANRYNGTLLPNTEAWKNIDARRAYRAALTRSIDDTIVTPGTELPLWTDSNGIMRLFAQFRSFTFSSTSKVLMAGAQDLRAGDMAPLTGTIVSLALGTLSYYTWATTKGGKTEKEMKSAFENSPITVANEAITRSGVMGVLGELWDAAERTPGITETFGGKPRERAFTGGPFTRILGPTFGGAIDDINTIATTLHDPKERTRNAGVRLAPYNNLWWLRSMMSLIDKTGSPIPEQLGLIRN